jgi:dTDP-4-dehydrorhamnose 3,5-epimerase
MRFTPTTLSGAYLIDLEPHSDARGFFARSFCRREFEAQGLLGDVDQCNVAFTALKGTIRGLHYGVPPSAETKIIRCTRGAIYDVMVDMRPDSPTYRQHFGIELSAENRRAVYVPPMFAHGYEALMDGTEVTYLMRGFYEDGSEVGLRYDDPSLNIQWPAVITMVSEKDRSWPLVDRRR